MLPSQRLTSLIAYLPIIGWIYVLIFARKDWSARFHLRQSVGLCLFLVLVSAGWAFTAWLLAWIPYAFTLGMALFSLPLVAYIFGAIIWVIGIVNALRCRQVPLPLTGGYSQRLPI